MKKLVVLFGVVLLAPLFFLSQQSSVNNVNGFTADPGSFEILNSYQGRNNVIKVDVSKTEWNIIRYPLGQYRGKPISIELSADVRREGSAGSIYWQLNDPPNYLTVSSHEYIESGQWHRVRVRAIISPMRNDTILYLSKWGILPNTVFYIANPVINITEGISLTPDLTLTPLKDIYANHFLIGNITETGDLYMAGRRFDLMKHHFNVVTSFTYPFLLAPNKGSYNFTDADNMVNIALRNNIQVFGHTLVWHMYNPEWFTEGTREEIIQNLNNYITTVVRHFRGRINTYDVVNEAIREGLTARDARGDWRNCLNDSVSRPNVFSPKNPWFEKLGADYVEIAFRAARTADPNIKLYYNDNNLEVNLHKAEAVCKMIQDINDRYKRETGGTRKLIEGVGYQMHVNFNMDFNIVRSSLEKLISLGIEVAITELDVSVGNEFIEGTGRDSVMSERDAITQALIYARLMNLFREYSDHIVRVTFWGMTDNSSWLSVNNPALFDFHLNAKPAFFAVSDPDGFIIEHGGRRR